MNVMQISETAQAALKSGAASTLDELENYLIKAVSRANFAADGSATLSSGDFSNVEKVAGSMFQH